MHRVGDVPGFQIPSRYFRFIRDGDARPLEAVLEHNRLDLVSLVAVMARVIRMIEQGPSSTNTPQECLGLARIYERAGAADNAEATLLRAIDMAERLGTEPEAHAEALAPAGLVAPPGRTVSRIGRGVARAGRFAAMSRAAPARGAGSAGDLSRASLARPWHGARARARRAQRRPGGPAAGRGRVPAAPARQEDLVSRAVCAVAAALMSAFGFLHRQLPHQAMQVGWLQVQQPGRLSQIAARIVRSPAG